MRRWLNLWCHAMVVGVLGATSLSGLAAPLGFNGYYAGMSKTQAEQVGLENCRDASLPSEDKGAMYCDIPAANRTLGDLTPRRAALEFVGTQHEVLNQIRLEFVKPVEAVKAAMLTSYGTPRYDGQAYVWEREAQVASLVVLSRLNAATCVTFDHDLTPDKVRINALKLEALRKQVVKNY